MFTIIIPYAPRSLSWNGASSKNLCFMLHSTCIVHILYVLYIMYCLLFILDMVWCYGRTAVLQNKKYIALNMYFSRNSWPREVFLKFIYILVSFG